MKIRNLLGVAVLTGAAVVAAAGPALASVPAPAPAITSTHVMFAVVDNGGVLVTRQPLAVHQQFYCGGIAYTVTGVRSPEFGVVPGFPASDIGKVVVCST